MQGGHFFFFIFKVVIGFLFGEDLSQLEHFSFVRPVRTYSFPKIPTTFGLRMKILVFLAVAAVLLGSAFACSTALFQGKSGVDTVPLSFYRKGSYTLPHRIDSIPILFDNRLPVCTAFIAGKPYRFLIDTGALTVVSEELYEELGLSPSYRAYFSDIDNQSRLTTYTVLPEIHIGRTTFQNIGAAVLTLSEPLSCFYDGIIGANLMAKLHWQFDYHEHMAVVSEQWSAVELPEPEHIWPFTTNNQKTPFVKGSLLQRQGPFMFDTGASFGVNVSNHYDFYKSAVDSNSFITKTGIQSFGIYGPGKASKSFVMKTDIVIGGDTLADRIVNGGAKALIGNDFLKDYRFAINWSEQTIHLKAQKSAAPQEAKLLEGFGYSAYIIDGKVRVVGLIEEAHLPLSLGDEILRVNETDYSTALTDRICDFIGVQTAPEASEVHLTVVRDADTLHFPLKKQVIP